MHGAPASPLPARKLTAWAETTAEGGEYCAAGGYVSGIVSSPDGPGGRTEDRVGRRGWRTGALLLLGLVLAALATVVGMSEPAMARTFYVSPSGSDHNRGTSQRHPWRSVERVGRARFRPGDRVLFAGGHVFSDDTLIPSSSGAPGREIIFGSYGRGQAVLRKGVWFSGKHDLVFANLTITDVNQGVHGRGDRDSVIRCTIRDVSVGINASGRGWRIIGNRIARTGDSGMLLYGEGHAVTVNNISDTGLDPSLTYGKHGIYLKAANVRIADNRISHFVGGSGISVRYRNSTVEHNRISGGAIGISWFQYDRTPGTSRWEANTISGTTHADIFVSGSDAGGMTRESFVIASNKLAKEAGAYLNLQPTRGVYRVHKNLSVSFRGVSRLN